jgi:hypothetical protein
LGLVTGFCDEQTYGNEVPGSAKGMTFIDCEQLAAS